MDLIRAKIEHQTGKSDEIVYVERTEYTRFHDLWVARKNGKDEATTILRYRMTQGDYEREKTIALDEVVSLEEMQQETGPRSIGPIAGIVESPDEDDPNTWSAP